MLQNMVVPCMYTYLHGAHLLELGDYMTTVNEYVWCNLVRCVWPNLSGAVRELSLWRLFNWTRVHSSMSLLVCCMQVLLKRGTFGWLILILVLIPNTILCTAFLCDCSRFLCQWLREEIWDLQAVLMWSYSRFQLGTVIGCFISKVLYASNWVEYSWKFSKSRMYKHTYICMCWWGRGSCYGVKLSGLKLPMSLPPSPSLPSHSNLHSSLPGSLSVTEHFVTD